MEILFTILVTASAAPEPPGPVLVVGVDGMTFDIIDPMVKANKLPNIAALMEDGTRAVLISEKPMRSPALWTTVATGRRRDVHQIYDFVTSSAYWPEELRQSERTLTTSNMRRSPALWNFAGAKNRRSLIVGWMNTWPAEKIKGVMISPYVALNEERQTTIKGRIYRDAQQQAQPPRTFEIVAPLILAPENVPTKTVDKLIRPGWDSLYDTVEKLERYTFTARWSIASTLTNTRSIKNLSEKHGPFDLVMTYFDGSDTLAHRFWIMREPVEKIRKRLAAHKMDPALAGPLKKKFGNAVDGYYQLIDATIGRMRAAVGPKVTTIVISDHGWGSSEGDAARHPEVPFDGEHRLEGVLIAHGPNIAKHRGEPLTLYEVAPTVMYLLGLDIPESLPGKVARDVIRKDVWLGHRPRRSKYDTPNFDVAPPYVPPHLQTEMERLKSLGYVE